LAVVALKTVKRKSHVRILNSYGLLGKGSGR
jgi:hypothetical protein